MKSSLPAIIDILNAIALSIWTGGTACALLLAQSGGAPQLYQARSDSLMELAGFLCIGAQFLSRRRFQSNRILYVGDGVRQLITFAALLLLEAVKLNMHSAHSLHAQNAANPAETPALALEFLLLCVVTGFTVWLPSPRALAFAALRQQKPTPSGAKR
jgi:hypothetical protein